MVDTGLELGRQTTGHCKTSQFGRIIGASMTTTILIVDDSKLARIVAGKAVSALQPDWQRVEAGNADEALELVGKTQIDVALLDFNMPGKNGVELAGELRLTRPTMPIALITANLQNEVIEFGQSGRRHLRRQASYDGRIAEVPDGSGSRAQRSKSMKPLQIDETAEARVTLTELERDALAELANIGVSRAASNLRKMVGQQVILSVPSVEVVSQKTAGALVAEREGNSLVAVRQEFAGAFSGSALLIFPQAKSLELIRAIVGPEVGPADAKDMEEEALAETGNIILNGCLATMANILHQSLSVSLPQVMRGTGERLFQLNETSTENGLVLFLYINFSILDLDIRGYIAMLMDLPSLAALKQLLGEFITSVMGEAATEHAAHN